MNTWFKYNISDTNKFTLQFQWWYNHFMDHKTNKKGEHPLDYKATLINRCQRYDIKNPAIMLSGGQDSLVVAHAFNEAKVNAVHYVYKVYNDGKLLNEYEIEYAEQFCIDNKKEVTYIKLNVEEVINKYKKEFSDLWLPHPDYFLQYLAIKDIPKKHFLCLGISMPGDLELRKGKMHFVSSLMGLSGSESFRVHDRPGDARFLTDTPETGNSFIFNSFMWQKAKEKTKDSFDFGWKNEFYNWSGFNIPKQDKQYIFPSDVCNYFKKIKKAPHKWRRFISIPYTELYLDWKNRKLTTYTSN